MKILVIPSAKVINSELQSRYGKIVPILIPLDSNIVLDKLYKEYEKFYDEIVITLYEDFENTVKIINSRNYSKLKIKKISELKDIGFGVYEVLNEYKNKNIESLSINFGDTFIPYIESFQNKNVVCYSKSFEIDRWAYFEIVNNKLEIKQNQEERMRKQEEKKILIGFFNIINFIKFHMILSKSIKENLNESLYYSLEKYAKEENVEFKFEKKWVDFGHLNNFLQAQKIVETRFFNEIKINKEKNILTKKSIEKEKLINEIKWFLTLPDNLQWVAPRVYSYSLEWREPKVSMEYYSYPTLHHLYLYGNHGIEKWSLIFDKLFYIQREMNKYVLKLEGKKIKKALNKIYISKTFERLEQLERNSNFSKYFSNEFYINGKRIKEVNQLKKVILNLVNELKINIKDELSIIHGDYFFANILYEPTADIAKLIDPRGDFGGYGIYGDNYYDLAKLAHSVDGMYDFIIEDLFELKKVKHGFNYKIIYSEKHEKIKKLFYSYFSKEERIKIKFIQALLFLSMVPLHKDKPERQTIMLGVGIRLLYEILDEKGVKL